MARRRIIVSAFILIGALGLMCSPALAATLYVDTDGACGGNVPCYTTINDAIDALGGAGPHTIEVFPGTYNERVDLNDAPNGGISLIAVNDAGVPTPGMVTITDDEDAINGDDGTYTGDVLIDGFTVKSNNEDGIDLDVVGDVIIRNCTASANGDGDSGDDGMEIDATGDVTITDCTANNNDEGDGFDIDADGDIYVKNCTANGNDDEGFELDGLTTIIYGRDYADDVTVINCTANNNGDGDEEEGDGIEIRAKGKVVVQGCTADGNSSAGIQVNTDDDESDAPRPTSVTITGCMANDNGADEWDDEDGIKVNCDGLVYIADCTANNNEEDGIDVEVSGGTEITRCTTEYNNDDGIEADANCPYLLITGNRVIGNNAGDDGGEGIDVDGTEEFLDECDAVVSCNDIADNVNKNGLELGEDFDKHVSAEKNWWGDATGPSNEGSGSGDGINIEGDGTVSYTPWLETPIDQSPECWLKPIPTLSHYGVMALVLLMGAAVFFRVRSRKNAD